MAALERARLREIVTEGGFTRFRRATEHQWSYGSYVGLSAGSPHLGERTACERR